MMVTSNTHTTISCKADEAKREAEKSCEENREVNEISNKLLGESLCVKRREDIHDRS
jgi:hypothetical protein